MFYASRHNTELLLLGYLPNSPALLPKQMHSRWHQGLELVCSNEIMMVAVARPTVARPDRRRLLYRRLKAETCLSSQML